MSQISIDDLLERAMYIGVYQVAYPIDVFSVACEITEHSEAENNLNRIAALIDDENYFTRWAAIRAINMMGEKTIREAEAKLLERSIVEDYPLAKSEIDNALLKI